MTDVKQIQEQVQNAGSKFSVLRQEISNTIVGQSYMIDRLLIGLLSNGHILLEGVPGLAKTLCVTTLAKAVQANFKRIQFTPDLLPADLIGTMIYNPKEGTFTTKKGPIFANLILADEINRAPAKVQSALLEAMQEHQVTIGDQSFALDEPFLVLATQNPIEQDGTYPLPEAQMDRFMFKLLVSFPTAEELSKIVNLTQVTMDEQANPVLNAKSLLEMRAVAKEIPVSSEVLDYTVKLVEASHPERDDAPEFTKQYVRFGASPRAAQNMITAAKVRALMDGRYNVSFDDIDALAYPVMRHRVKPSFLAITEKIDADTLVYMLLEEINGRGVSSDPKEVAVPKKKRKRLFG